MGEVRYIVSEHELCTREILEHLKGVISKRLESEKLKHLFFSGRDVGLIYQRGCNTLEWVLYEIDRIEKLAVSDDRG